MKVLVQDDQAFLTSRIQFYSKLDFAKRVISGHQTGLSHFFEHMMFNWSKTITDPVDLDKANGRAKWRLSKQASRYTTEKRSFQRGIHQELFRGSALELISILRRTASVFEFFFFFFCSKRKSHRQRVGGVNDGPRRGRQQRGAGILDEQLKATGLYRASVSGDGVGWTMSDIEALEP